MKLGLCELDDVISNGLGGLLGYFVAAFIRKKTEKRKVKGIIYTDNIQDPLI